MNHRVWTQAVLTRTSHQLSAATAIWHCLLRYAPSASSTYRRGYVCGSLGRKPRIQNHLGGFATKAGEKSGLTLITIALAILVFTPSLTQAQEWEIECVDCPDRCALRTDRSMQVDPEGRPHIAYGGDHLLYAWHDGVSWQRDTVDPTRLVGHYASIALSQNGEPHIAYTDDPNDCLKYAYRDAAGWHIEMVTSTHYYIHSNHVSMALDPDNHPHIVYQGPNGVMYAYREPLGWHIESIPGAEGKCSLAIDASGYPHIVSSPGVLYTYRNENGWFSESVSPTPVGGGSLALDDEGNPHIAYSLYINVGYDWPTYAPTGLRYAYRGPLGWQSDTIDVGLGRGGGRSIALDPEGQPMISYCGNGLLLAGLTENGWQIVSVDSLCSSQTSLAVDASFVVQLTYMSGGNLRHVWRDHALAKIETVDEWGGSIGIHTSFALDTVGRPHAAYTDYANDLLKYAFEGSEGWTVETVLSGDYVHRTLSIAVDSGDSPHIAFYRGYSGLCYARKSPEGWVFEIPDPDAFGQISLAMDTSDDPHISYKSSIQNGLKYAHKEGQEWSIEEVDCNSGSYAGISSSIALDPLGFPCIAYVRGGPYFDVLFANKDSTGWHIAIVEDLDSLPDGISLELDTGGRPHISYSAGYPDDQLSYAWRDGDVWQIERLPAWCETDWVTSLELDQAGFPHIAFEGYDLSAGLSYVGYIHKDALGWHLSNVAPNGRFSSPKIALDDLGGAHLIHTDYHLGDLLYAYRQPVSSIRCTPVPDAMDMLTAWPNPSFGMLHVRMSGLSSMHFPELGLFDLAGRLVMDVPAENMPIAEDAIMALRLPDGIPNGQYFLSLKRGTHVETVPVTVLK